MKKRSMLAIASLATGFVVAAVTPSHAAETPATGGGSPATGLPAAGIPVSGAQTKVAGVNVEDALDTVGRAINRETDRAVNDAPHGKTKNSKKG
ncbi:hypothetical protein AB0N62_05945 [Streptomyces sp. NPDC093982]|uniref:hypothetical protein n=1 Tax=Streptomyces sp. NPDC093982 TaxID=3155077 RepID=UPI003432E88C